MVNITITEWDARLPDLADAVRQRWPWFSVSAERHGIHVQSDVCSATVDLENVAARDASHFRAETRIVGASGLMRSVAGVRHGAAQYLQVCDALDMLTVHTESLRIWPVGACPCDSCSGRGKEQGRPCKTCDGKGVR